jgi:hypothetical protein
MAMTDQQLFRNSPRTPGLLVSATRAADRCGVTSLRGYLLRRALERAAQDVDRGARRDADWLRAMGLTGCEAGALARELRILALHL